MAQWRELLNLDPALKTRVKRLYHDCKFPVDVRRCFSEWIEAQDWASAAGDEATARTYFQTLLLKLEERSKESLYNNHTLEGPDFSLLKDHLMTHFEHCPVEMAGRLSECLTEENVILDSHVVEQRCIITTKQTQMDVEENMNKLKNMTKENEEEINVLEGKESMFKKWESQVKHLNGLVDRQLQTQCFNQGNDIRAKKMELVERVKAAAALADDIVQALVSVELPQWKRTQQMSCIGNPVRADLKPLEKRFSAVGELLLQILRQQKKLHLGDTSNTSEVLRPIHNSLTLLLKSALVVEEQPAMSSQSHRPLVLRTTVSFTVKLRFLANLSILEDGCLIRAEFDKDVKEVETIKGFRQFQFDNNRPKAMSRNSGSLVTEWSMVIFKKITENNAKRKRSNQTPIRVAEELHVIRFSTDLRLEGLQCQAETSSLPVVVMSTTTQCPSAWASVLWYNLLSVTQPTSLSVFLDPPPLPWELLSQALSWQFISAGDRELNQDQLNELKLKITDDPDDLVSWASFSNQEHGPWVWIDGILDLIEKHLKELWRAGTIMGFVNKENVRVLLRNKPSGTFLLRFSESNRKGAISFSVVEHSRKKTNVRYIDPFVKEELSRMSLADHVNQYREKGRPSNPLVYLYPDTPKDRAFGRYYSTPEPNKPITPYVKRKYVCEEDSSTPSSSPDPIQMDLDLDSDSDIPTSQLGPPFDSSGLFSEACLNLENNRMDI